MAPLSLLGLFSAVSRMLVAQVKHVAESSGGKCRSEGIHDGVMHTLFEVHMHSGLAAATVNFDDVGTSHVAEDTVQPLAQREHVT
ncbi:hypothetical protein [Cupriavidus basilensis]|uniref:Uncharacterized protein n=1 Tax=Cupriavidus basilensis TaxID=68895 RepID=A0A7M2H783_9BURK|nr:hypothetical protein [Cupriavidus basilensis]QOT80327.1 hypothetical protein F7R26_023005 [Cupriavidus basilensis]